MTDEINKKRGEFMHTIVSISLTPYAFFSDESSTVATVPATDSSEKPVMCAPGNGCWEGGDNVLMVLTKLDRNKGILYCFVFIQH